MKTDKKIEIEKNLWRKIRVLLAKDIWHNGNTWDYGEAEKSIYELINTEVQKAVEEAVRGLIEYLEANTEKVFYLGCGKMINEYLGTVESEK